MNCILAYMYKIGFAGMKYPGKLYTLLEVAFPSVLSPAKYRLVLTDTLLCTHMLATIYTEPFRSFGCLFTQKVVDNVKVLIKMPTK